MEYENFIKLNCKIHNCSTFLGIIFTFFHTVTMHLSWAMKENGLISAFVVRCLDSVMSLVSVAKISSLMLASVAEQTSLSLTWSETLEDTFSHDEAHL